MKISEKQILQLMQLATGYTELIALLDNKSIKLSQSDLIREGIAKLFQEISNQQCEELKEIQ